MGIANERQKLSSQIPRPCLYLITDRQAFSSPQIQIEMIAEAAQAGCQLIQIREKDLSARELYEFTCAAIQVARPHAAKILVNDRVDVALAAKADGIHLRVNSLTAEQARQIVNDPTFIIGVSTHSLVEAKVAENNGADFVVCGPVFETPSKAPYGKPLGLENFAEICTATHVPVLALGGVSVENFSQVLLYGAVGVAGIGLFQNRETLASSIKMMLSSGIQPQD